MLSAKDMLSKYNININSTRNSIFLKHIDRNFKQSEVYHRVIHTDKYYYQINARLELADKIGSKKL